MELEELGQCGRKVWRASEEEGLPEEEEGGGGKGGRGQGGGLVARHSS